MGKNSDQARARGEVVTMIETLKGKVIGVVCGGYSFERDVSLRSGQNVCEALIKLGYNVKKVDPAEDSKWFSQIDVAFLALHGANGEDGSMQAFLGQIGIPYTGSGVGSSILSMNKLFTKELLHYYHLPTAKSVPVINPLNSLPDEFSYPVIVKPFCSGSSVDVYVVDTDKELEEKVSFLLNRYHYCLLEMFIEGTEITVGILDYPHIQALPILELRPKNRFYDYEAKYTAGLTEFIVPAELSDNLRDSCQLLAIDVFKRFKCKGMARVDMILADDQPYILEVNTLPGLTDISDLPAQAICMGMSFELLIENILHSAIV